MNRTASLRRWAVVSMGLLLTAGLPLLRGQESGPKPPAKGDGPAVNQPAWAKEAEDSVKPLPLESIPDDPPPHEGALFEISHRIEPTDLVLVEVLEALPGRPISGERLVQPNGVISLQWYGEVHVSGLTAEQAKVKIVHHLRRYLLDQTLGLIAYDDSGDVRDGKGPKPADTFLPSPAAENGIEKAEMPPLPPLQRAGQPADLKDAAKKQEDASGPLAASPEAPGPKAEAASKLAMFPETNVASPLRVPPPAPGVKPKEAQPVRPVAETNPVPSAPPVDPKIGRYVYVAPDFTTRAFVDVTAYNSKFYYVHGDVAKPGRLPYAGLETVLDAIVYAGGFLSSADRHNIRLNRPARGGQPTKSYKIDFDAIERGEKKANLQMFPGDRLIIERKKHMEPRA